MVIGFAGVGAHLSLTTALSLAPASTVVPVDFARLPIIAAVGAALYNEAVGITLVLGAALILMGILVNLRGGSFTPQGKIVTKL